MEGGKRETESNFKKETEQNLITWSLPTSVPRGKPQDRPSSDLVSVLHCAD